MQQFFKRLLATAVLGLALPGAALAQSTDTLPQGHVVPQAQGSAAAGLLH